MPNRSRTPPADPSEAAHSVLQRLGLTDDRPEPEPSAKNAAAVELGRRGGLKGGKARAASLTPEQRKASAEKAAQARWRTAAGADHPNVEE